MRLSSQKIVFGKQTVNLLLNSRRDLVIKLFCLPASSWIKTAKTFDLPYQICSKTFFTTNFANVNHQGIIAQIKNWPVFDWKNWWKTAQKPAPSRQLFLMLDHIEDSYNLGAIIRTAVAYNVQAIILPNYRQVGLNPVVAKTSTGALFHIPIITVPNLARIIKQLKTANFWIITTALKKLSLPTLPTNLEDVNLLLIMGNEQKGVSQQINQLADFNLVLPMQAPISSLNVSVATGISLYAIRDRQKHWRN